MIRLLLIVFFSFIGISVPARQIRLSSDQIEAMFLKQNLALIAERMNVSIADAAIAEATVWDNPELSVGDINFWKRRGCGCQSQAVFARTLSDGFAFGAQDKVGGS